MSGNTPGEIGSERPDVGASTGQAIGNAGAISVASGAAIGPTPVEVVVSIKVTALAYPESDGGFSITIPEIPGLVTCCDSAEDIVATVREAADAYLPVLHDK